MQAKAISETYTDLTGFDNLMAATTTARTLLRAAHQGTTAASDGLSVHEAPDGFENGIARLQHCCETGAAKAKEETTLHDSLSFRPCQSYPMPRSDGVEGIGS
jgi:hypothetical protein